VVCDRCGSVVYYNEGSRCTCEWCEANLDHLLGDDSSEVFTLADLWDSEEAAEEDPP
jgi:hypothetical protein